MEDDPTFRVLCIGGSDPRMGAGVQMDAAVCRALGFDPVLVVTVDTVQGERGLESVAPREPEIVAREIVRALFEGVDAVKVGALGNEELTRTVAAVLEPWAEDGPIVVDPVVQASRVARPGVALNTPEGAAALREELFPLATLVTPNRLEYGSGEGYANCSAVLRKGGHDDGDFVVDRLTTRLGPPQEFRRPRLPGATQVHGTGCAFATLCACLLGRCRGPELACPEAGAILHGWLSGPGLVAGRLVPPPTPRRDWPASAFRFPNPARTANPS